MSEARTELSALGEFGLIQHLTGKTRIVNASTKVGIGDDAAAIENEKDYTLVTTDMLMEGVHFDLSYAPLKHLGYKAVIVNLSDIYAMNGKPEQITVSIALSNRFSVEAIEELYKGIHQACEFYKVDLVGGDTTTSRAGLGISITAIGRVDKDKVALRSTAKEGDLVLVSGDLGGAYMGLQVLEREKSVFKDAPLAQPVLEGNEYILERQLKPEARFDVIEKLAKIGVVPTSMIDISDGLASEVMHIGAASNLGCQLYEDKIPVDQQTYDVAREFNLTPSTCALNGGEDYELLFTVPQSEFEKVKDANEWSIIGHMTESSAGFNMVTKDGISVPLEAQGWNHLSND